MKHTLCVDVFSPLGAGCCGESSPYVLKLYSQGLWQVLSQKQCRPVFYGRRKERIQSGFETPCPAVPPIGYFSFLSAHRDYSSHGGWSAEPAASAGGRLSDL